jgi:dTDP-4-amino-4,6-dideoxygalactose transaminase
MIPVTKPFLPPKSEYYGYLDAMYERNWLTNNGPYVRELEENLSEYLGVEYLRFVSNGTIALQIAIKALELKGEIITTPFSYVATTSSIVWEGCTPVFVDIDQESLCIDPIKIEVAITSKTSAILATHIFGNPCDVEAIQAIADKYGLKVIYDAAHAFGVKYKGESIFNYGDISITSFHATKLFHTIEGGGMMTRDTNLNEKIKRLRNFGHKTPVSFDGVGINGKNSEVHAAMGLTNLKYIKQILQRRKELSLHYDAQLEGLNITRPSLLAWSTKNYSYYPAIFEDEAMLLKVLAVLEKEDIYPRRYFYPSLSSLDYVEGEEMPISDNIASRILCLPLYHTLEKTDINRICDILAQIPRMKKSSHSRTKAIPQWF